MDLFSSYLIDHYLFYSNNYKHDSNNLKFLFDMWLFEFH